MCQLWWRFICFNMLHMTTSRWRFLPSQQFWAALHLHLTITALNKRGRQQHEASAVCRCVDPYVLAHFCPSPAVSVSTLSRNFCTVLAWICPQASLVNVPSHTMLISVLVRFCSKTAPARQFTDLSILSFSPIRQNGFSLIVHGSFLHPVCYIDSPPFFLFFSLFISISGSCPGAVHSFTQEPFY